jgi:methyl-accepting chemotaxis protein
MLLLGGKLANVYPQGRLVALVKSVNLQILISLLLITPLLVLIGMFLSHRIAGPIYRLEMALANISKGDMTAHITLRPKDELKPLAAGINAAIDALRSRIASERGVVDNLHKIINELDRLAHAKPFELGPLTNEISRLKGKISDLDKSLAEYKI